jgi:phage shock protein PspC (stress-responsive transcriptional regulator)
VFVWVAVFVVLLTVMGVIYYLIRVRRHPEEETRLPE